MTTQHEHDLHDLRDGFARFYQQNYGPKGRMTELVRNGQKPKFAAILCSDSRTPEQMFDQGPGAIFVPHRGVGALYRGYGQNLDADAGIEYAVKYLGTSHLMVVAHYGCGFVKGMVQQKEDQKHQGILPDLSSPLARMMDDCDPLYDRVRQRFNSIGGCRSCESHHRHVVEEGARWSLENLADNPIVREAVEAGKLKIWALVDDIDAGELLVMQPRTKIFQPLFRHGNPTVLPLVAPHCADAHLAGQTHVRFDAFKHTVGCAPGKSRGAPAAA